jgi:hypothetical protein
MENNMQSKRLSTICLKSDKKVVDFHPEPLHIAMMRGFRSSKTKGCIKPFLAKQHSFLTSARNSVFAIALCATLAFSAATGWGQTAQSLPYSYSSGRTNMTSANGWSYSGVGTDYSDTTTPIKFDTQTDTATLLIGSSPSTLTYYLKGNTFSGGTFTVEQSADGTTWSTLRTVTSLTSSNVQYTDNLTSTTRWIRWTYTTKSAGNVGMGTIAITAATVTPTVATPTATSILTTSATLGANITLNGGASITSRGTVWGTSASPTGNSLAEGGTSTGIFTHSRTGLTANTLYYYRGYAVNSTGTGYSADGTFTTLPLAPTVGTGSSATTSSFTANWSHPTMGSASYTYTVEVDDDSNFGSVNATQSGISSANTSQAITGLSASTTYYFRVKAVNGQGSSDWSSTSAGVATTSASGNLSCSTNALSAFSGAYGAASSGQSFSVEGSSLDGSSVTVTPPAGFEVATSSDFTTTLGTSGSPLNLGTSASISIMVYVRLAATTGAGSSYGGNISIAGGGASTQTVNIPTSTVAKVTPTISQAPTAAVITVGQTLASATLSGGAGSVAGTFAFTAPATVVSAVGTSGYEVTFTPTDTANYNTATTTVNVTAKNTQTITFNALPDKLSTDSSFSLGATASSTLAVTYTSSNTGVATVSGNTVTIVGPGITTITASQAGDESYFAATDRTQEFKVVDAPLLAAWDFTGENATTTSSSADTFNASLDSSSNIIRGAGATGSSGTNSFRTQGFKNDGISTTNTDYFQITLSASSGRKMSLSKIDARLVGTATFVTNNNYAGATNQFAYSLDGTTFTLIGSPTVVTTNTGSMPTIDVSGVAALQNVNYSTTVTLRFYASGQTDSGGWGFNSPNSGQYGLSVSGTTATFPEIFTSGSLSAVSSTYGTASGSTSFSVSASNLTAGVSIQPPAGFEVSTSSTFDSNIGDNGSPLVVGSSGALTSTTIYVRIKASTVPSSYSGNIVLSSAGATSVNVATVSSTVGTKALTVTGLTGQSKGWDGTTAASATGTASLSGIVGSDEVTLTGTPTFTFANADVGTGKVISTTGYELGGAQALYYTVTQPELSGDITAVVASAPTITGITEGNHELTVAFNAPATSGGVTVTDYKYSIDNGATYVSAGVTASPIIITGLTNGTTYDVKIRAVNSAGDGTESAAVQATPTAPAVPTLLASVETLTSALTTTYGMASSPTSFSVSGASLTGSVVVTAPSGLEVSTSSSGGFGGSVTLSPSSGNVASTTIYIRLAATAAVSGTYNSQSIAVTSDGASTLNVATAASGNTVSAKGLTITGLSVTNKVYDGTTTVSVGGTAAYDGLANGESHAVTNSVTWAFGDKTVANGKVLVRTGDFTAPNSNYTISSQPSLSADITAKELTVGNAAVTTRAYNATTSATITGDLQGIVSGDAVTLNGTGTFASANAGEGISVTSTSTLGGADAGNYSLTQPTGLTGTINKASQTITFGSLASKVVGDAAFNLTGSSTSGLTVSYASSDTNVATLSEDSVALVGAGLTTITASQAGNENYEAAASVQQVLEVNYAQETIFSENMGTPSATTAIGSNTFQNSGSLTYSGGGAASEADVRNTSASSTYTGASGSGNIFFSSSATGGDRGFSIESINASNHQLLKLQFGYRKSSGTAHAPLSVDYWNGSAWVSIATTSEASVLFNEAANATTGWYLSKAISLPEAASRSGLKIRFIKSGSIEIRLDDVKLTGSPKFTPSITANPTSSALTYGQGLSQAALTGGSASVAGAFAFTAPATVPNAGTYSAGVTFTPDDTANYKTITTNVDVTVTAASLASGDITLTPGAGNSYTASGPAGSIFSLGYAGRSANGITTAYSSSSAPTAAGYYTVTATATGNYSGSNTADFYVAGPVLGNDSGASSFDLRKPQDNSLFYIDKSVLLANDKRIDTSGHVQTTGLDIASVTAVSGSISYSSPYIAYTPTSASTDSFTYAVTADGVTATATVTVIPETNADVPSFTLQIVRIASAPAVSGGNTTVTLDFIGVPNKSYEVLYKGDLGEASWTTTGSHNTGSTGSFSVTVTKAGDHVADWASMFFQAKVNP